MSTSKPKPEVKPMDLRVLRMLKAEHASCKAAVFAVFRGQCEGCDNAARHYDCEGVSLCCECCASLAVQAAEGDVVTKGGLKGDGAEPVKCERLTHDIDGTAEEPVWHTCPKSEEVSPLLGEPVRECSCCSGCTAQCAMDR
jgi:hypothetical protein